MHVVSADPDGNTHAGPLAGGMAARRSCPRPSTHVAMPILFIMSDNPTAGEDMHIRDGRGVEDDSEMFAAGRRRRRALCGVWMRRQGTDQFITIDELTDPVRDAWTRRFPMAGWGETTFRQGGCARSSPIVPLQASRGPRSRVGICRVLRVWCMRLTGAGRTAACRETRLPRSLRCGVFDSRTGLARVGIRGIDLKPLGHAHGDALTAQTPQCRDAA